jgi:hypothetical protein
MSADSSGPAPLTGLLGFVNTAPEAPPEKIHGGPADPRHAVVGENAIPYSWMSLMTPTGSHGPYGPGEAELISDSPDQMTFRAGQIGQDPTGDLTPYLGHGAPNIKGPVFPQAGPNHLPAGNADYLAQSAAVHGVRTNAGAAWLFMPTMEALNDSWTGFYNRVPGDDIVPDVPGQVSGQAGGFGSNDHRNNAYAKVNSYDYATSHRHRRYATGSVPGNVMWMRPSSRMMIKSMPMAARPPVGVDSPFAGQDLTRSFNTEGAILSSVATQYVAPPVPNVTPAQQTDTAPPPMNVWW